MTTLSDRDYFQALYDAARDCTMKAYYAAAVRERNHGVLGPCQHVRALHCSERSYGSTYYWRQCEDCGFRCDTSVTEPW